LIGPQNLLLAFRGVSFKGGMNNSTVWHTAIYNETQCMLFV